MEDLKTAVTIVFTIIGGVWAFWKVVKKPVLLFIDKSGFQLNNGYLVTKSIEKEFGKDAGIVIKALIVQQSRDHKTTGLRLEKIESHAGLGIYACDAQGDCTFANPALADMFEMEREQMYGYGWLKNIVDKKKAIENWKFCVEAAIPYSDTYQIKTESGTKTIYTEATPNWEKGVLIGYVGICKEVK